MQLRLKKRICVFTAYLRMPMYFAPVQGIPAFHKEMLSMELWTSIAEAKYFPLP